MYHGTPLHTTLRPFMSQRLTRSFQGTVLVTRQRPAPFQSQLFIIAFRVLTDILRTR